MTNNRITETPDQLHGGIIFGILECTLQWTFYSKTGHVGPTRKFIFDPSGQVFIGKPVKLVGSVTGLQHMEMIFSNIDPSA
jgi:hypothetical protein